MKKISTFKVAGTYIGTVVGAGFASGQELLQFFSVFGINGFWGLILVTCMFMVFGYLIMKLGMQLKSRSHMSIVRKLGGRYFGPGIDWIITFFLFGSFTAMIAGAGATLNQQFNVPILLGNAFIALITAYTVMLGLKGIINSISLVAPFLIVAAIGVSILGVIGSPGISFKSVHHSTLMGNWLVSAALYVSYNIIIAIAVLGPLGAKVNDTKVLRNGAILGGLGLGVCAISIFCVLSTNIQCLSDVEVPMMLIAQKISPYVMVAYSIILLAEIYTTAVSSLYGFVARLSSFENRRFRLLVILSTISAFLSSQLGFSNMVRYLYPIVGYGGFFLLASLMYYSFQQIKRQPKSS